MAGPPDSVDGGPPAVPAPEAQPQYVGLATRAISFIVDAALIDVVAIIVGIGAGLILSLFHLPKDLKGLFVAIGAAAYILWSVGYFVFFWSTTGQTPGARLMQIRVVAAKGGRLKPRRALVRGIGVILATVPLFLGYVPALFDHQRRALPDYMARTRVIEAEQLSFAEAKRARMRAAHATDGAATSPARSAPERSSASADGSGMTSDSTSVAT